MHKLKENQTEEGTKEEHKAKAKGGKSGKHPADGSQGEILGVTQRESSELGRRSGRKI